MTMTENELIERAKDLRATIHAASSITTLQTFKPPGVLVPVNDLVRLEVRVDENTDVLLTASRIIRAVYACREAFG